MSGYEVTYRPDGGDRDCCMYVGSWTPRDAAGMASQGYSILAVTYHEDCPSCGGLGRTRHAPKGWRKGKPVPQGMIAYRHCDACNGSGFSGTWKMDPAGDAEMDPYYR